MPNRLSEIKGQPFGTRQLKEFLVNFKRNKKRALLIYGPSGCGKTSAVYAAANDLGLEVLEINASDVRNQAAIENILGSAVKQQSLLAKGKLILVDELDGISGRKDRGGASTLAKLIDGTTFPIVITANDPFNRKFSALRKKTVMVEFQPLDYKIVSDFLVHISKKEKLHYDEEALIALARRSAGDLRGAVTDLQILATLGDKLTLKLIDTLGYRMKEQEMQNALVKVFKNSDIDVARTAFDDVSENLDEAILWLDENLPREYTKPKDLELAYYWLSLADVYRGRIRRWQYWRLLAYVNIYSTAGIATAKESKYESPATYRPTSRLLKMYIAKMRFQKRRNIADKIADSTFDSSKNIIKSVLPYLLPAFKKNRQFTDEFAARFQLDEDEIAWLRK